MINISKVKQLMKEKGLKVQYVCDKLGASRYKMYDWERGKSTPSENEIEVLASILETTADYITDKTDIKEQKNKPTTDRSELKPLARASLEIIDSLPEDLQKIALAQLRALAAAAESNKKN